MPGHYLQGVYANRCPSLARAIFASGLFAEGWAVYVTQVMMDLGYGEDDPALLLIHWKFYLRAITNAIIDAAIHCDGMTEDEAVELMVDGGFQEEAEARAKCDRARLTSTQLSTYFVGRWRCGSSSARPAAAPRSRAGDPRGADAVPEPSGRRRLRRDAGLRLPPPPRIGHLARHAADVAPATDPPGLNCRAPSLRGDAGDPTRQAWEHSLERHDEEPERLDDVGAERTQGCCPA